MGKYEQYWIKSAYCYAGNTRWFHVSAPKNYFLTINGVRAVLGRDYRRIGNFIEFHNDLDSFTTVSIAVKVANTKAPALNRPLFIAPADKMQLLAFGLLKK